MLNHLSLPQILAIAFKFEFSIKTLSYFLAKTFANLKK